MVLGGLVVSFAGVGFSCSLFSSVWGGAPVPFPKHQRAGLSQVFAFFHGEVRRAYGVTCQQLCLHLLKTRQTERRTLVLPIVLGFDPFHEVYSIEKEAWVIVVRGHVVVGEVSSCWILRGVGGGAAGHRWRSFSAWALIYTGGWVFLK